MNVFNLKFTVEIYETITLVYSLYAIYCTHTKRRNTRNQGYTRQSSFRSLTAMGSGGNWEWRQSNSFKVYIL